MKTINQTIIGKNFKMKFTNEDGYYSFIGDYNGGSGAVTITEEHPKYKCLDALHLVDCETKQGVPGVVNFIYYIKEKGIEEALNIYKHYSIPDDVQLFILKNLNNEEEIKIKLSEIFKRQNEQYEQEAFKLLEELQNKKKETVFKYDNDYSAKINALSEHLTEEGKFIKQDCINNGYEYECLGSTWKILTDEEADEKELEYLRNYCEECIVGELDLSMQRYFDIEKWVEDNSGDRGNILAGYDGEERKITTSKGETFYIYKG